MILTLRILTLRILTLRILTGKKYLQMKLQRFRSLDMDVWVDGKLKQIFEKNKV